MVVNLNIKPRKSFVKKLIILILFSLFCFFIKEKVFALSSEELNEDSTLFIPSVMQPYLNYSLILDNSQDVTKYIFCNSQEDCNPPNMTLNNALFYFKDYLSYVNTSIGNRFGDGSYQLTFNLYKSFPYFEITYTWGENNELHLAEPHYTNSSDPTTKFSREDFIGITCRVNSSTNKNCYIDYRGSTSLYPEYYYSFIPTNINNQQVYSEINEIEYSEISYNPNQTSSIRDNRTWLQKIWDGIKGIGSSVGNIASDIISGLGSFFSDLGNKIQNVSVDIISGLGSFFSDLGNKIIDIRDWLLDLGSTIVNGVGNFISDVIDGILNLGSSITDFIHDFFIPDTEMMSDTLNTFYENLRTELGFLAYPIDVIVDFANRFYSLQDNGTAIFNIPTVSFMGVTLIHSNSIDLMSIVNQSEQIRTMYDIYKIVVSGFIVLWLVQLAIKKEHEIFGGGRT